MLGASGGLSTTAASGADKLPLAPVTLTLADHYRLYAVGFTGLPGTGGVFSRVPGGALGGVFAGIRWEVFCWGPAAGPPRLAPPHG
jgi:hypothetical protein